MFWCVPICLKHGIICFVYINCFTLLSVVYDAMIAMHCILMCSNTLVLYMGTVVPKIFEKNKDLFKNAEFHYVFIYLIGVPVYHFDFNHLRIGEVPIMKIICLCLH